MQNLYRKMLPMWLWACLGVLLLGAAPAGAAPDIQDLKRTRVDFSKKQGAIADFLREVAATTDFVFLYDAGLDEELRKTVNVAGSRNLYDFLDRITRQAALEYQAVNRNIVIRKRTSAAPPKTAAHPVSGRVSSKADGSGLPGVNILVKGTTFGTTTSATGDFSLEAPDANAVLVFSYVGYETQEIALAGRSQLQVSLVESSVMMQEFVVTALGIKREKKSLGYAVGEVSGEQLNQVAQENVLNALAGKVAGVTMNQTSGVGSSVSMVIRGATSLTSDNQPLFVIDGVPVANSLNNLRTMGDRNEVDYGNAISDLNPDDIASISVLKGPSAAALYGSRAGNGVVLITTKSGAKGQGLGVAVSTSNVFEEPVRYLDFHYKYGSGSRNGQLDESSAYWAGPALDAGNTAVQWNSPLDANGNKVPTPLLSYKDNMKNFLQTGITSTNNLSLSGSADKLTYRISYNNMSNRGLIPNANLIRNSLSTATTFEIHPKVKLSANLNLTRSTSNDRPATSSRGANPLEAVYVWPHVDVTQLQDYWMPGQEQIQQRTANNNFDNPYFIAHALTNAFDRDRAFGNLKLDWTLSPAFSFFARASQDMFVENRETKIPWSYSRERKGGYYLQDLSRRESNVDFLLTFSKETGPFSLRLSGGGNYMHQRYRDDFIGSKQNAGLIVPGLYRVSNIPITGLNVSNYSAEKGIYSLYAMSSLGFRDMLYLDLTARNDWSSTLPAANRSYFYPSASLSWLANHSFQLPAAVSLLKLRAGWAQVGNDTDPYQLSPVLGTGNWGDLITTSVSGTLLNAQLKPEIATSTEAGLDASLFHNRLRLEATYFYMENKNQILRINTPASSGYNNKLINAGLLASRGWELSVGGTPLSNSRGWKLDLNANLTRIRTTVEELTPGIDFITLWDDNGGGSFSRVGEQIGNLYSRGYATVKDPASPYYGWPILSKNGEWISVNDRDARMKVGNFNPDLILGGQLALSYKRFTLGASFDWRIGGNFQSYTYRYGESDWRSQRQIDNLIPGGLYTPDALAALLKSNPGKYIIPQNGNFPRVGGYTAETGGFHVDENGSDGAFIPGVIEVSPGVYEEHLGGPNTKIYPVSDMYPWSYNQQITFDASFLKLRELSLGYDLPRFWGLRNAHFALFSRNIMVWTAAKIGIDPERAFQATGGKQGDTASMFRQGIELQNVMPWTVPVGFKLNFSL